MWFRSQDLFTLVKCERLFVRQCASDSFDVIGDGVITLGSYSTLDKAFAVLDEIQGKIEFPYPSKVTPAFGTNCYHLIEKNKFYQMPQDEDVEA